MAAIRSRHADGRPTLEGIEVGAISVIHAAMNWRISISFLSRDDWFCAQMTYGFSRDDIGGFLPDYLDKKILPVDPFQVLDRDSVGVLVKTGIEKGRSTKPDLKVGICGEHGGEPNSVEFCHLAGMNYVSCSPFRVPIARLAAAQAQINHPRK